MKLGPRRRRRRSKRWYGPAAASVILEAAGTWWRSGRLGGDMVVRCRAGHLFTTLWIPAVSIKSLRLGWWRCQYCPVGQHLTLVTPVRAEDLSPAQRREAAERRDIRLP
jgi:hypothetical protein